MASNTTFLEIIQNRGLKPPISELKSGSKKETTATDPALPVKGGRQTTPEGMISLSSFFAEMQMTSPDFNIQLLNGLEKLAIYHSDFSYAVENIVTLGNTPFKISFDDKVPEKLEAEMHAVLTERMDYWYSFSGGINSLINDLLAQAAINGAISGEIVPTLSLDGIDEVVKVSPKTVRFKIDPVTKKYKAVQLQSAGIQSTGYDYIELNPITYHYIASRRIGDKPYAIPPFISSLDQIAVEKDIMSNFASIVKNIGVLGFLEVLVNAPAVKAGEDEKSYYLRTQEYLNLVIPEIEKGMSRGFSVGFKDKHEFKMQNTNVNVQGAKDLIEINDVKKMAGFKQDPLMFGRNFSTTETLGRVILAKMTTQVGNYQQIVASLLSKAALLELQFRGYPVSKVFWEFDKPMVGDRDKEETARGKQIDNLTKLYKQGIIDQKQFAAEAGYEKPALEEPIPVVNPITGDTPPADNGGKKDKKPKDTADPTGSKKTDPAKEPATTSNAIDYDSEISFMESEFGYALPDFPYEEVVCCSEDHTHTFTRDSFALKKYSIEWWAAQYNEAVLGVYKKCVKKTTKKIANGLDKFTEGATEQQITDYIIHTLYKEWGTIFTPQMKKIVSSFVGRAYKYFRADQSIFDGVKGKIGTPIPVGAFNTIDFRSLEYYKNTDSVYLGKFITDDSTKAKITQYIKDNYLTRDQWIGKDPKAIQKFKDEFEGVLNGQDWKIAQIINTTITKMRNTSAVNYFNEAGIEKFEIQGVNDRLQCGFCKEMQGKTFSVSKGMDLIKDMLDTDPESIGVVNPFVSSKFKKPEMIANLTGEELQASGINTPPYHPSCRDRAIAVI